MGSWSIFKSEPDPKEKAKQRRKALRKLDDVVFRVGGMMSELSRQQEIAWKTAKQRLAVGNKTLAKQSLKWYRMLGMQIDKLGIRQCVFQSIRTKAEMLDIDITVAPTLSILGKEFQVDVDTITEMLESGGDIVKDLASLNNFWERTLQKSVNEADLQTTDAPSFEDMFSKLEAETAIDIGRSSTPAIHTGTIQPSVDDVQSKLDTLKESSEK